MNFLQCFQVERILRLLNTELHIILHNMPFTYKVFNFKAFFVFLYKVTWPSCIKTQPVRPQAEPSSVSYSYGVCRPTICDTDPVLTNT